MNQPSYDIGEPDTTQTDPVHQDDDTQQVECHNPIGDSTNTTDLNTDENDRATVVPRSPAPEPAAELSDSDSDDCIIQKVSPPPEKIDQAEAPPPGMPKTKAQLKLSPDGTGP